MPDELNLRIHAVARRALAQSYFFWDWGEAIVTRGLLAASSATCEPEYYRWVTRQLERWMERSPRPFWPDHVGPGDALLDFYEHAREPRLLEFAQALGEHFDRLPRATTGAPFNRPDKADLAGLVWVDSIHTDGPFLARLGHVLDEPRYIDLAAEVILGQIASLQDPATGLFAHSYSDHLRRTNGVFWARGCGWAALGLAEGLRWLPADRPATVAVREAFEHLASAMQRWQGPSGHWHTVVDHPDTYLEHSATSLVAEALSVGLTIGVLPSSVAAMRDKAWCAIAADVGADGSVLGVSERTPSSQDPADYAKRATGGTYAWGQGPWLLIAARMASHGSPGVQQDS